MKSLSPGSISATGNDLSVTDVIINGSNLSGSLVELNQAGVSTPGTIVGTDSGTTIRRRFNLLGKSGSFELIVTNGSGAVKQNGLSPGTLGGFNVTP